MVTVTRTLRRYWNALGRAADLHGRWGVSVFVVSSIITAFTWLSSSMSGSRAALITGGIVIAAVALLEITRTQRLAARLVQLEQERVAEDRCGTLFPRDWNAIVVGFPNGHSPTYLKLFGDAFGDANAEYAPPGCTVKADAGLVSDAAGTTVGGLGCRAYNAAGSFVMGQSNTAGVKPY